MEQSIAFQHWLNQALHETRHSLINRLCSKKIIVNLLKQWWTKLMIMNPDIIGLWLDVVKCHLTLKQSWVSRALNASNIQMKLWINSRPVYVHTVECKHRGKIIGKLMLQLSTGQVFVLFLLLQKFTACPQKALTLCLHFFKQILRSKFIRSYLLGLMLWTMTIEIYSWN